MIYISFSLCFGQGSIFGAVNNADLSVPANGEIYFAGYLDDTDEEIRIENSIGSGFDGGNWYDDFQNYLTEAPGNPYDYHFFNITNNEGFLLSDVIPFNSFQQEDIQLAVFSWPPEPVGINAVYLQDSTIKISWDYNEAYTYRLYRRLESSGGSFYRVDDPSGSLSNYGVANSFFIDSTANNNETYNYIVIPIDNGTMGAHSQIIPVESIQWICGDINGNGAINILDITFFIAYLYKGGPMPDPPQAADVNNSGSHNILDLTYLLNYLYKGGPAPICPDNW